MSASIRKMPNSKLWHCQIDGEEIGPISSAELKALTKSKKLRKGDLVRRDGGKSWVNASRVPGLFSRPDGQPNSETPKPAKKTSAKKRRRQASDRFDRFYGIFRVVRWTSPLLLAMPYFLIVRRLSFFIVDPNHGIVNRPRYGGLLDLRALTPIFSTPMFIVGLFGFLTFAQLMFAPENWLKRYDHGRFWFDISGVSSLTPFRIAASLIAIAAGAMLFLCLGLLFQGPWVNSPSFLWAIGLEAA